MMKDFLLSFKIKILQATLIILLFQQLNSQGSSNCDRTISLEANTCFNNLIQLGQCENGQFAEDKYGNMFILYSASLSGGRNRLFYGLKKDGRIFFPNANPYNAGLEYQISSEVSSNKREHSRVIFLNSGNNDNQYLLSISPGDYDNSITELYEIGENAVGENEIIISSAKATRKFESSLYGLTSSF